MKRKPPQVLKPVALGQLNCFFTQPEKPKKDTVIITNLDALEEKEIPIFISKSLNSITFITAELSQLFDIAKYCKKVKKQKSITIISTIQLNEIDLDATLKADSLFDGSNSIEGLAEQGIHFVHIEKSLLTKYTENNNSGKLRNYIKETTTDLEDKTLDEEIEASIPDEAFVEDFINRKPLYPNLVVERYRTVIAANQGFGKTALIYFHVVPEILENFPEYRCLYFDTDASHVAKMKELMNHFKVKGVKHSRLRWHHLPKEDTHVNTYIKWLSKRLENENYFKDTLIVIDVLKDFIDTNQKGQTKDFFKLIKRLNAAGATVIVLHHSKKYRDKTTGRQIFDGVSDVVQLTDNLIFLEQAGQKDEDGSFIISTECNTNQNPYAKTRGHYFPLSFKITNGHIVEPVKYIDPGEDQVDANPASDTNICIAAKEVLLNAKGSMGRDELIMRTQKHLRKKKDVKNKKIEQALEGFVYEWKVVDVNDICYYYYSGEQKFIIKDDSGINPIEQERMGKTFTPSSRLKKRAGTRMTSAKILPKPDEDSYTKICNTGSVIPLKKG